MKTTHKTLVWLAFAIMLIAAGMAFTIWSYHQIEHAAQQRQHSREVLQAADMFLSQLKDAETGQRGYALTGTQAYLKPYLMLRDSIKDQLAALRQITQLPLAQKHLDAVAPLLDTKLADMAKIVALRARHDIPGMLAMLNSSDSNRLMDSIRLEMYEFNQLENDMQLQYDAQFDNSMRRMFVIILCFGALTLLFSLYFAYSSYRRAQQRLKDLVHRETRQLLDAKTEANRQLQETNQSLQISEQKLATTLNSIGDAVIATDAMARVTLLNPVAEMLTGWTHTQAQGHPVQEVFHIIDKATRQPATTPVTEALLHGTIQGSGSRTVLIARDGREFDVAENCAPIREVGGLVVGAVLVFHDVTDEHAMQESLRDSASLVQTILNTVVDGIVTVHAHGGIMEAVNPAIETMFGYSAAELSGKKLGLLIPELDQEHHNVSLEHFGTSDETRAIGVGRELMGTRKDGSQFPLEIAVNEMVLRGQRYFTGILRDITTRKGTEAQYIQLNQTLLSQNAELEVARAAADKANLAKSEFLSSMSHELRSPLNAILGFAQLMESEEPAPTPAQKTNLKQILKAGWYLLELINEILDLALIESGTLTVSIEPLSLPELLLDCKTMVEPLALKRDIHLEFSQIESPCYVAADQTRLKQVIVNLLTNAIKYNRLKGTVNVSCSITALHRLRVTVRDTGEGLSDAKLAQLFQPFNRLGQEETAKEGTGIGLVLSKRLVELMGGNIGAQSTRGVGSEFWIELDLAEPAPQVFGGEVSMALYPAVAPGAPRVRTLLYVEDNKANMELVTQIIARRPDMYLLRANNGVNGLKLARTHLPEVILLDINLPGISGLEVLRILREDPLTRHIPVLALSANAMQRDIEKGLEAGFLRYLTKPIKIGEFLQALNLGLELAQGTPGENDNPITRKHW